MKIDGIDQDDEELITPLLTVPVPDPDSEEYQEKFDELKEQLMFASSINNKIVTAESIHLNIAEDKTGTSR